MEVDPGVRGFAVSLDGQARPVVEFDGEIVGERSGLKAQGVAGEVGDISVAVEPRRNAKLVVP